MYRRYICDRRTVYIAYWRLYCVKKEAILAQISCSGAAAVVSNSSVSMLCVQQLTMWYGSANHSGNDENKHDEVTFQLAAVDLNSSTFMVRNRCDRYHILKDNSWMCISHQYHKAGGLLSKHNDVSEVRGRYGKYISL